MTNILLVTNGFPPNNLAGVEIYTSDLANGLRQRGHHVSVFCRMPDFSNPDYKIIDEEVDGIRVIRVVNDYKRSVSIEERFADKRVDDIFENLLVEISPQLIHFNHLIALSARLPLVANEHQIPSVFTLHDYWSFCQRVQLINWQKQLCPGPLNGGNCPVCVIGGPRNQFISKYLGWLYQFTVSITPSGLRSRLRKSIPQRGQQAPILGSTPEVFQERYELFKRSVLTAQRLLVPSYYVRTQFLANGYPSNRIEVVPLGITPMQPTAGPALESKPLTFSVIGTFIPTKGIDVLIKAFKNIPSARICMNIYGPDDIAPTYTEQLKKLAQGDDRIRFKGTFPPEQREQIYKETDALVVPSLFPETYSLVSREALSQGKPVIASRIGALPEVIIDNVNGFLFEPGSVPQLTNILRRITNNPQILSQLSCPGPVTILTLDNHIERVLKIYGEVLSGDQSRVIFP